MKGRIIKNNKGKEELVSERNRSKDAIKDMRRDGRTNKWMDGWICGKARAKFSDVHWDITMIGISRVDNTFLESC